MAIQKLHSEKRIKAVDNITGGSQGDPVKFEAGDIVYDLTSSTFKKKNGALGAGSWDAASVSGATTLVGLSDTPPNFNSASDKLVKVNQASNAIEFVDNKLSSILDVDGYNDSKVGHRLEYSYVDPQKTVDWTASTTLTIRMVKSGKRGAAGNSVAIDFVDEDASAAGVASYNAAGSGTLQVKYDHGVTTATQMKSAIDGVADFEATITGTAGHTADNAQIGADTTFANGSERWEAKASQTVPAFGGGDGNKFLKVNAGSNAIEYVSVAVPAAYASTSIAALSNVDFAGVTLDGANGDNKVLAWNQGTQKFEPVAQSGSARTVEVDTDGNGSADFTLEPGETLRFKKGNNITLTESAGVIEIAAGAGGGDSISLNDTAVTITDSGANGKIELKTDNVVCWNIAGHIIPATNDTFDIGSAEYKVRDLYVSDNSLWIGDDHKIEIRAGEMKFRKRKLSALPSGLNSSNNAWLDDATYGTSGLKWWADGADAPTKDAAILLAARKHASDNGNKWANPLAVESITRAKWSAFASAAAPAANTDAADNTAVGGLARTDKARPNDMWLSASDDPSTGDWSVDSAAAKVSAVINKEIVVNNSNQPITDVIKDKESGMLIIDKVTLHKVTCHFSQVPRGKRDSGIFYLFPKDQSEAWDFKKEDGTLRLYNDLGSSIGDGADINVGAGQFLKFWFEGAVGASGEWRYMIRTI
jgi:hypothetical protein